MQPREAPRAYVDHPVTDLAAAARAARTAAEHWSLAPPGLLRAGMNAIHAAGSVVLRVSAPSVDAAATLDLHRFLADQGVRVPVAARPDVVEIDGLSVTCWERLAASSTPTDWRGVGAMVRAVHRLDPASLPPSVPLPRPARFPWWDFDELLARTADVLDPAARSGLEAAVERHRGWQDAPGEVVCHGDVHPGNVMMTDTGPVLLDWDLLCWANPGWDHGPMLTWATRWGGDPDAYAAFADGYGCSFAGDPVTEAFAELRLVAATLMRVAAGRHDPTAFAEAQRRLAHWRGDPDAPQWSAQ
jgi:hypothetical protein